MTLDEIRELLEIETENIGFLLELKNNKELDYFGKELIREQLKFNIIKMRSIIRTDKGFEEQRRI